MPVIIAGTIGIVLSVCGWNIFVPDAQDGWVSGWYIGVVVSSLGFVAGVLLALGVFDHHEQEQDPRP